VVENEIFTVKICKANFVWILLSLRASPLKIPQGLCPLTPPLLKKWTKLLIVIAIQLKNHSNRSGGKILYFYYNNQQRPKISPQLYRRENLKGKNVILV